jgi:ABC-type glycerol-3-phosphate transport system permease component
METKTHKRKKFLPFLQSKKNRILFTVINVYLVIGISSLVITLFYLLAHLETADSILKYCIPGFVLGISSGLFYFLGYQSMKAETPDKKHTARHIS